MRLSSLTDVIRTLVYRYRYAPHHALFRAVEIGAIERVKQNCDDRIIAIDAGCGDGTFFNELKGLGMFQKSFNIGVDIHLSTFEAKCVYDGVVLANIEILPFRQRCAGIVFSNCVIEHIRNPRFFLSEIQRLVEPKGRFIVTTVSDKFEVYSPEAIVYKCLRKADMVDRIVRKYAREFNHNWHFTRKTLAKLFTDSGLQPKSIITYFPPLLTVVYFALYKLCRIEERIKSIHLLFYGLSLIVMHFLVILLRPLQLVSKYGAGMLVAGEISSQERRLTKANVLK